MKKLFPTGIAVLLLATGAAHARSLTVGSCGGGQLGLEGSSSSYASKILLTEISFLISYGPEREPEAVAAVGAQSDSTLVVWYHSPYAPRHGRGV
jgi:hypothetical protein